jgi:hypothetical protein
MRILALRGVAGCLLLWPRRGNLTQLYNCLMHKFHAQDRAAQGCDSSCYDLLA